MAGSHQSATAGAIISIFIITGLLFKFSSRLWKRRAEAVAAVQAACQGGAKHAPQKHVVAGDQANPERNDLEEGCKVVVELPVSEALRVAAGFQTPGRPQTPAEVLALQRASTAPIGFRASSPHLAHRGMASAPRPQFEYSLERPSSRCSGRSLMSNEKNAEPNRPWSAPSDEMIQSDWWAEAREWWPEAVASDWESPYRPSSKNLDRKQQRRTHPEREIDERPTSPDFLSTRLNRQLRRKEEGEGVYLHVSWVDPASKASHRPCISAVHATPSEKRLDHTPPPPFATNFYGRFSWDTSDLPWDASAPKANRVPPATRCHTAPTMPSEAKATWEPVRPGTAGVDGPPKAVQPPAGFNVFAASGKPSPTQTSADARIASMILQLKETREEPLAERKRLFRELQRQLHPDKNMDRAAEAKLAFQELMQQRAAYLRA